MTNNTQPEALRLAEMLEQEARLLLKPGSAAAASELRRQHARIAELEAQLEAVGAGGVQELSAAPAGWKLVPVEPTDQMVQAAHHLDLSYMPGQEGADRAVVYRAMLAASPTPPAEQQAALKASPSDIAKLRHLYANLKNGGVRDTAQAKRIADGLLAPIIERLEQAATTGAATTGAGTTTGAASDAEQAATNAAPGERLTRDQIREVFMSHGFTIKEGQTDLKQYVYDAAHALLELVAAPQQEAQEPVWDGKLSDAMQNALDALYLECGPGITRDITHQVQKECEAIYTSYTTTKRMYQAARDRLELLEAAQPQPDPFAAPQQGVQEPVAWLYTLEYGTSLADRKVSIDRLRYPFGVCGSDYLRANNDGTSYVRETPLYKAIKDGA